MQPPLPNFIRENSPPEFDTLADSNRSSPSPPRPGSMFSAECERDIMKEIRNDETAKREKIENATPHFHKSFSSSSESSSSGSSLHHYFSDASKINPSETVINSSHPSSSVVHSIVTLYGSSVSSPINAMPGLFNPTNSPVSRPNIPSTVIEDPKHTLRLATSITSPMNALASTTEGPTEVLSSEPQSPNITTTTTTATATITIDDSTRPTTDRNGCCVML